MSGDLIEIALDRKQLQFVRKLLHNRMRFYGTKSKAEEKTENKYRGYQDVARDIVRQVEIALRNHK